MTRSSTTATVAVAILLFSVAACAGNRSGVVYFSNFTAGYDPHSLSAAMSRAPLLVETFGLPAAGLAQQNLSRTTALALRQHGSPWLPRNYTDSAVDAANGPYRLRIAYAAPKGFDSQLLCGTAMDTAALDAARRESDAESSRTVASLCRGQTAIGIAEGSPGANPDVSGESFGRFVGALGREVMPRRNPVLDDDCQFRFCD